MRERQRRRCAYGTCYVYVIKFCDARTRLLFHFRLSVGHTLIFTVFSYFYFAPRGAAFEIDSEEITTTYYVYCASQRRLSPMYYNSVRGPRSFPDLRNKR